MSLTSDDLRPCKNCGTPCDGDVCSTACENDLWHAQQARKADAEDDGGDE